MNPRSIKKFAVLTALVAVNAFAQQQAPQIVSITDKAPAAASANSALVPAVANEGDSIAQRAQRAEALEAARLRAEQAKLTPAPVIALSPVKTVAVKVPVPRAELYVEAIRGAPGSLEAVIVINAKYTTGSSRRPTLADGWSIASIDDDGVVVVNGKEKRSLAFVGPEPYMPSSDKNGGVSAAITPTFSGATIPSGRPMPVPVGGMVR